MAMSLNGLSGYTKTAHGEIRNADIAEIPEKTTERARATPQAVAMCGSWWIPPQPTCRPARCCRGCCGAGWRQRRCHEDIHGLDHRRPSDRFWGVVLCDKLAPHADRHALRLYRALPQPHAKHG